MIIEVRAMYAARNKRLSGDLEMIKKCCYEQTAAIVDLVDALEKKVGKPSEGKQEREFEDIRFAALYLSEFCK